MYVYSKAHMRKVLSIDAVKQSWKIKIKTKTKIVYNVLRKCLYRNDTTIKEGHCTYYSIIHSMEKWLLLYETFLCCIIYSVLYL